jgi:uncharacterized NAD-dependent epimerase/dehydratase family protein
MDGTALVLCDGHFNTTNGKTAHGLVRGTERYRVLGVIDHKHAGKDAGDVLDGKTSGIPIFRDLADAIAKIGRKPDYLVVGVAPEGGRLPGTLRAAVLTALRSGINVDSGLHEILSDDPEMRTVAESSGAKIRDIRRCKPASELHFFEGKIEKVESVRIAFLGTDSAIGKRTTARIVLMALRAKGIAAEMVGTGQTSWLQGAKYSMMLDATVNDFVSGEIEHAVYEAWINERPRAILLEGQGCLTNPGYPGGFEILAAARPHAVVLQHAPKRKFYDGFPEFPLAGLDREKTIIELLSQKPVIAITINHEDMTPGEADACASEYERKYGIPACDVLLHGPDKITEEIFTRFPEVVS